MPYTPGLVLLFVVPLLACCVGLLIAYVRGDRRRDLRRCPKCWYDLAGTETLTCPECGLVASGEAALHTTRRRPLLAGVAGMSLAAALVAFTAQVARDGFFGAMPRPVVAWLLERSVNPIGSPTGDRDARRRRRRSR